MTNIELKDNFSRHTYLTSNQNPIYLLDQNVERYSGTRPKKHFIPLRQVLPQNTLDEQVLEYAIKNDHTIITNDRLFVINNLIKSRNVIYQDSYGTRFYFRIKESFIFDTVDYFDDSKQQSKSNILFRIKNILCNKKLNSTYLLSFETEAYDHNKSNDMFVHALNVLPKAIRKYDVRSQIKKVLKYAVKNNLTIVTRHPKLCILSLLKTKRCIFEDEHGTRYYITIDDIFEFEKVLLFRQETKPDIPNIEVLEYNIENMKQAVKYIENNLFYLSSKLQQKKKVMSS